jgi:hypothetical protein
MVLSRCSFLISTSCNHHVRVLWVTADQLPCGAVFHTVFLSTINFLPAHIFLSPVCPCQSNHFPSLSVSAICSYFFNHADEKQRHASWGGQFFFVISSLLVHGEPVACAGVGTTVASGHPAAAGASRAPSKIYADCGSSDSPFIGSAENIVFLWMFGWLVLPGSCTLRARQWSLSEHLWFRYVTDGKIYAHRVSAKQLFQILFIVFLAFCFFVRLFPKNYVSCSGYRRCYLGPWVEQVCRMIVFRAWISLHYQLRSEYY